MALVSGAIAGIAGVSEVAGIQYQLTAGLSPGFGYTGIVVAMLGGLTMPGVLIAGLLLGDLAVGASSASRPCTSRPRSARCVQGTLLLVIVGLLALRRAACRAGRIDRPDEGEPPPDEPPESMRSCAGRGIAGMNFIFDLLAATLRNATPLVYGTVGETYAERAGILNLGIEGTMYAGAFFGFAVAYLSGRPARWASRWPSSWASLAGAVMGVLTVTLGANQHVSGLGLTIVLIGLSEFGNRLLFTGSAPRSSASTRSRPGTRWAGWVTSAPWSASTA